MGHLLLGSLGIIMLIYMVSGNSGSSKPNYKHARFYLCDPKCPKKCSDEKKVLCVNIYEIVPIQLEFHNKCFFDCANICYEHQLTINNEGLCLPSESTEGKGG